ncbi:MAG TPA: hypothetical protein VFN56_00380 [Candidatus Saccharimonadales bacterium]|nr:hypothetical protein [Candidatus Saccharimonadales bacterium]
MAHEQDKFGALAEGIFSSDELAHFASIQTGYEYALEPIMPSTKDLLEMHDSVNEAMEYMRIGPEWEELGTRVSDEAIKRFIWPGTCIQPDEEIVVRDVHVLHVGNEPLKADEGCEVMGNFMAFSSMPAYVLFDEAGNFDSGRCTAIPHEKFLHCKLAAARLINSYSGDVIRILGNTSVSLQHGAPRLYRVLRQVV